MVDPGAASLHSIAFAVSIAALNTILSAIVLLFMSFMSFASERISVSHGLSLSPEIATDDWENHVVCDIHSFEVRLYKRRQRTCPSISTCKVSEDKIMSYI